MSATVAIYCDWDHDIWSDDPSFADAIDDITDYVKAWHPHRGLHKEFGNVIAGSLSLTLMNDTGRFSPPNAASPLYGKLKIWRPVKVVASEDGSDWTLFRGFISSIRCHPHHNKQEATIRCSDGLDLIARHMLYLDKENRTASSPGTAIGVLLDAVGWPAAWRDLDTTGGTPLKYPAVIL